VWGHQDPTFKRGISNKKDRKSDEIRGWGREAVRVRVKGKKGEGNVSQKGRAEG